MKCRDLIVVFLLPLHVVFAGELPDKPHLIIEGYGMVEQIPDRVIIRFEVSATAETLSLAKQAVDKTIDRAIKAAQTQQVKDENISASKIQALPQFEWRNQNRVYKGERVNRQVEVKLLEVDRYNDLVEALLAAGVNRLQPVQLDFSQRKSLEAKALTLALDNAQHQADIIANHLGASLGTIFQIAPVTQLTAIPRMAMTARAESRKDKSELKLGKQKLERRVRVVYLLEVGD
ncbi:MAG: SIMPL domain-containing protein [Pseudomonadales bacterium]